MSRISRLERWTLPNGLTVLYRLSPEMPIVAASLLFRSGSFHDPAAKAGLASLTMDLLLSGTRRRSAEKIAETVEFIGASLGTQCSEDYSEAGFICPAGQWKRLVEILADVLQHTVFPADEVGKEKAQTLAALSSRHDTIFNVAHDRFNRRLFGDHPYGRLADGTPETVTPLRKADFSLWLKTHARPDRAVLSLVGPLPRKDVERSLLHHFSSWRAAREPFLEPLIAPALGPDRSSEESVKARFEQAYLMTGTIAPAVRDDGYMALKVLNTLLGGGMSSRLFLRLREDLGLAYEVASFFPTRVHASQWVLYMGLPHEKLPLARRKMEEILEELADKAPSASEVAQAKQMITGAFLMEQQTRRRQAWYAAWWEFLGRGSDYDRRFVKEVEAVTPQAIHALARRLLAQPRVTVTVAPK